MCVTYRRDPKNGSKYRRRRRQEKKKKKNERTPQGQIKKSLALANDSNSSILFYFFFFFALSLFRAQVVGTIDCKGFQISSRFSRKGSKAPGLTYQRVHTHIRACFTPKLHLILHVCVQ